MVTNNSCDYSPVNHAVQVGGVNGTLTSLSVGTNNSILVGNTSADPSMTTTGNIYISSVSFDAGSNTMDSYVEATSFSPTIAGSTVAGTGTYTIQQGYYILIGDLVNFWIELTWTSHSGTGNMLLQGLPFTIRNLTNYVPEFLANTNFTLPGGTVSVFLQGTANTTQGSFVGARSNAANTVVVMSNTGTAKLSGSYIAV